MSRWLSTGDVIDGTYKLGEQLLIDDGLSMYYAGENETTGDAITLQLPNYKKGTDSLVDKYIGRSLNARKRIEQHGGHPNIVSLVDIVEGFKASGMVLGGVPNTFLEEFVSTDDPLSTDEARDLGLQLCDALGFLHEDLGMILRDFSPRSIPYEDGNLTLLDFTTAKSVEAEQPKSPGEVEEQSHTEFSDIGGRGKYKPGEIVGYIEVPQGPWSDVYTVGKILLWATTGNIFETAGLIPSELGGDVDAYLDDIIRKATAEDPTQRYLNAAEMKQALEAKDADVA